MLALQIVLSRLIGSTVSYYFAFLLISLAMLGLGSGALLVQLAPRRFTPERCAALRPARRVGYCWWWRDVAMRFANFWSRRTRRSYGLCRSSQSTW